MKFFGSSLPLLKVELASRVLELAFTSTERFVGLEDLRGVLVCFDVDGRRVWERAVDCAYPSARRVRVAHNRVWLDCRDRILSFDFDGNELAPVAPPLRVKEEVGQFLLGGDSIGVSLYRDEYQMPDEAAPDVDLSPRVMRLNFDGQVRWQADLPVHRLEFGGIVSRSRDSGWESQPMKAWRPRSWKSDCYVNDGLLLSGDLLLASFIEISSGIGFSYALRWSDGQLLWTSEMCPYSNRGIFDVDSFVFSVGGYGDRRTFVLNERGEKVREWARSGSFCVSNEDEIWLEERGETTNQRCHAFALRGGGTEETGAVLSSYSGAQPALSQNGMIFWRYGQLLRVDAQGRSHVLNAHVGDPESRVLSRTLLDENGTLLFATAGGGTAHERDESCLWIAREKLAPLSKTPWPCGDGNSQANPVWREQI